MHSRCTAGGEKSACCHNNRAGVGVMVENDFAMLNQLYLAYMRSHAVTTDSRAITPGCIFFAFRGEHFDGNAFAPQALEQGAAYCVVDSRWKAESGKWKDDPRIVGVPDVLQTLQQLAALHRSYMTIPVVGITGTNGKTTTKELVHAVLGKRYRTAATRGNHNNHLGVPLTLLAVPKDAEMAVVEMGANHPGEIAQLCAIADPDCGLITNVGRAHLEGFGSFEGVVRTKTELYRHLAGKHGLVFVNADDERLMDEAEKLATMPGTESALPAYAPASPIVSEEAIDGTPLGIVAYGSSEDADVRGTLIVETGKPFLRFYFEVGDSVYTVQTHLLGNYNFANCMAAVAVGLHFGVEPWDIKEAIEEYVPSNQRSEYKESPRGNHLYLDCYNANPSSMAAAIASFGSMAGARKMAVVGGMKELGAESMKEHERLVNLLAEAGIERVLLVGHEFDGIGLPQGMAHVADTSEAAEAIRRMAPEGYTILVKGSNGNRLWTLEEVL